MPTVISVAGDETAAPLRTLHVADAEVLARCGPALTALAGPLRALGIGLTLLTDAPALARHHLRPPSEVGVLRALQGWRAWRLGRELTRRFDPPLALVQLWGTAALHAVGGWARNHSIPCVIYVLSEEDVRQMLRRGIGAGETVVAACSALRTQVLHGWPAGAHEVLTIMPAVAPLDHGRAPAGRTAAADRSAPAEQPSANAATPADEHVPGIVWTGRLDEYAGLPMLVEALGLLQRQECDFQTVFVGSGPAEHLLWRLLRRHHVDARSAVVDGPGCVELALRGADVLVVPQVQRALSCAPLLALAGGTRVVAAREQLADWLDPEYVLTFAAGAARELATRLERALYADPVVGDPRDAAAIYVRTQHAPATIGAEWERLYRALTGEPRGPTQKRTP